MLLPKKFERLKYLIGEENVESLADKCVLVIGLGGVGGYSVESLVRSGIGHLIIVDGDVVDETNLNRQIIATSSVIGKSKVDLFNSRIKDINPDCVVTQINKFIDKDNIDELFCYDIDYLIDACDSLDTKFLIIKNCLEKNIPFISSMGTGNRMDPSKFSITTLDKTMNDPVAKILRKRVRDEHLKGKIKVLCSSEVPKKLGNKIGSNSFVPPSAGLLITSYVINDFINKK
ncbi:MAG: tRNA threonylcarbamoyladenosine dehydratase [Bacilli bacterium]|nr:tRNA threonylcarbamoyladenosine dehydratase [Bacilli bacterium]